jgi:RNA:NAD 2'-phosphotransferase (TPT1/KptA family)
MKLLREYIRELLLKEVKSTDLPWADLSNLLQQKFPDFGEEVTTISGKRFHPLDLRQATVLDRGSQRLASFWVGYGDYDYDNPATKVSSAELDAVVDEIDRWAREFGLHVARDELATNSNIATLKIGLMDLETDEVEKPSKLYHVTDPESAEMILSQGLQPRSARRRGKAGKSGDMTATAGRSYPDRIFMFTDAKTALGIASKTAKIMDRLSFVRDVLGDAPEYKRAVSRTIGKTATPVVLEIDGDAVGKIMTDPDFEVGSGAVFTTAAIPPSAITKYKVVDRGDFQYNWRSNYKVKKALQDDYEGTMAKIRAWERSQDL